jgi:hypothetical protein
MEVAKPTACLETLSPAIFVVMRTGPATEATAIVTAFSAATRLENVCCKLGRTRTQDPARARALLQAQALRLVQVLAQRQALAPDQRQVQAQVAHQVALPQGHRVARHQAERPEALMLGCKAVTS